MPGLSMSCLHEIMHAISSACDLADGLFVDEMLIAAASNAVGGPGRLGYPCIDAADLRRHAFLSGAAGAAIEKINAVMRRCSGGEQAHGRLVDQFAGEAHWIAMSSPCFHGNKGGPGPRPKRQMREV